MKHSTPKIIHITAKCSDMFTATLDDGRTYDGYVPDWMPGEHGGDYVELSIDIATGKILNWKAPTAVDFAADFK